MPWNWMWWGSITKACGLPPNGKKYSNSRFVFDI